MPLPTLSWKLPEAFARDLFESTCADSSFLVSCYRNVPAGVPERAT